MKRIIISISLIIMIFTFYEVSARASSPDSEKSVTDAIYAPSPSPQKFEKLPGNETHVSPAPSFPKTMVVVNKGENSFVEVKVQPNTRSKTVGKIFGSLTGIEVLRSAKEYSFVRARDYDTGKTVEGYIPKKLLKTVHPRQDWGILVVISEQKIYIYKNNSLAKSCIVSTGIAKIGAGTPTGTYLIGSRGKSFYSPKYGQGGWNWIRFNHGYLFHSIPFDKHGKVIQAEANKLGSQASHGCVRLSLEDSKWLYYNIPKGTPVIIQDQIPVKFEQKISPPLKTVVRIDGNEQQYDPAPIKDGGVYAVPLRKFIDSIKVELGDWDPDKRAISIKAKDITIEVTAGSRLARVNGKEIDMPLEPKIINGTMYVPLRFIAESFGCEVSLTRSGNEKSGILETIDINSPIQPADKFKFPEAGNRGNN